MPPLPWATLEVSTERSVRSAAPPDVDKSLIPILLADETLRIAPKLCRIARMPELWACSRALSGLGVGAGERKSTRLNSSHVAISYAVLCWSTTTDEAAS